MLLKKPSLFLFFLTPLCFVVFFLKKKKNRPKKGKASKNKNGSSHERCRERISQQQLFNSQTTRLLVREAGFSAWILHQKTCCRRCEFVNCVDLRIL